MFSYCFLMYYFVPMLAAELRKVQLHCETNSFFSINKTIFIYVFGITFTVMQQDFCGWRRLHSILSSIILTLTFAQNHTLSHNFRLLIILGNGSNYQSTFSEHITLNLFPFPCFNQAKQFSFQLFHENIGNNKPLVLTELPSNIKVHLY